MIHFFQCINECLEMLSKSNEQVKWTRETLRKKERQEETGMELYTQIVKKHT